MILISLSHNEPNLNSGISRGINALLIYNSILLLLFTVVCICTCLILGFLLSKLPLIHLLRNSESFGLFVDGDGDVHTAYVCSALGFASAVSYLQFVAATLDFLFPSFPLFVEI